MNRFMLLRALHQNRTLFQYAFEQIHPRYLLEPVGADQLSAKDILAHISRWEVRFLTWLQALLADKAPISPVSADLDSFNAQALSASRQLSWQEVQANSITSFRAIIDVIESTAEELLEKHYPYAWSWKPTDNKELGKPLWLSILSGPCYSHYQDHLHDLLIRWNPLKRPILSSAMLWPFVGLYAHPQFGTIGFRIDENEVLCLQYSWDKDERELPGLAVDPTRFAFPHFGMVAFNQAANGDTPSLEWNVNIFPRIP